MFYVLLVLIHLQILMLSGSSAAWEQVGPGRDKKPESFQLPTPKPQPPKEGEQSKK